MPRILDLTGERFGRLTALSLVREPGKPLKWLCQCDCGNTSTPTTCGLRTGNSTSCGCLLKEKISTHGLSKNSEYTIWENIIQRCTNPNYPGRTHYSERGISICERWRNSFADFYADMGPRPTPRHQIDRIDNDGNYEPGNCRWVTPRENANNRSTCRMLTARGETKSVTEWARDVGISPITLSIRIRRGWNVDKALFTAPQKRSR